MSETQGPSGPEVTALSAVGGVFTRPGATFSALIQKPTWWLPFVAGMILSAIFAFEMPSKMDYDAAMREAITRRTASSGTQMSAKQLDDMVGKAADRQQKIAPFQPTLGAASYAAVFFFFGLILLAAAKAIGAEVKYPTMLSVFAYAGLPLLAKSVAGLVRLFTLPDASIGSFRTLSNLVDLSPAALLHAQGAPALTAFLSSFDLLLLATFALLIVAFRKLPGVSAANGTITVVVLWVLLAAVRTGFGLLFG